MADRNATDWFAWFIAFGFYFLVAVAMWRGIPEGTSHDIVLVLITAVTTNYGMVMSFRYGTTASSEKKTEQITDLTKAATVATATAASVQAQNVASDGTRNDPTVPPIVVESVTVRGTETEGGKP